MRISKAGLEMIVAFEGMELSAYRCPAGVWTIGVGHTGVVDGEEIRQGMVITAEKAMELLQTDVRRVERYINRLPFADSLTQCQFDALVSFVFNIGSSAFRKSTMFRILTEGAADKEVAKEFGRWVYGSVNGEKVRLPGLVKRRKAEAEMFLNNF